jgi:hypothetical protein
MPGSSNLKQNMFSTLQGTVFDINSVFTLYQVELHYESSFLLTHRTHGCVQCGIDFVFFLIYVEIFFV